MDPTWAALNRADAPMHCTRAPGLGGADITISRIRPHQPRMYQHTVGLSALETAVTTLHSVPLCTQGKAGKENKGRSWK